MHDDADDLLLGGRVAVERRDFEEARAAGRELDPVEFERRDRVSLKILLDDLPDCLGVLLNGELREVDLDHLAHVLPSVSVSIGMTDSLSYFFVLTANFSLISTS